MNAVNSPTVQEFADWWLKFRPYNPPEDAIRFPNGFAGVVVFRDGQYQVQLFVGQPGARPPRHTHPNVDAIEYMICGEVDFESEREEYYQGRIAHVEAGEPHSAVVGDKGACFYSIQKWMNGVKPSSVELDWTGPELDDKHAEELKPEMLPILQCEVP